jgi:hypothetical protein
MGELIPAVLPELEVIEERAPVYAAEVLKGIHGDGIMDLLTFVALCEVALTGLGNVAKSHGRTTIEPEGIL